MKISLKETLCLSFSLAKTNFKLRNEGRYLGIFWYLLNPLGLFLIILFIKHAAFPDTTIEHYSVYLLMGIAGFNFFRQTVSLSISSIHMNGGFIKSLSGISLEAFVLSQFIESTFSHIFEIILLACFMVYFGLSILWLPLYFLAFLLFAPFVIGISFIFATGGTYMRDLENVWNIANQLLFFGTPIFYIAVPGTPAYMANLLNPLFYFLSIARDMVIYHTMPPIWMAGVLFVSGTFLFFLGIWVFKKYKHGFSELV